LPLREKGGLVVEEQNAWGVEFRIDGAHGMSVKALQCWDVTSAHFEVVIVESGLELGL